MKNLRILLTFLFIFKIAFSQDFLFSVDGKIIPAGYKHNNIDYEDFSLKEDLEKITEQEEKKLDEALHKKNEDFKILFIGDSMVEAIEKPSKFICTEKKLKCDYLFKRGLRTDAWTYNGWYGVSLILKIAEFKPDIIVISSGTNDIYNKETPYQIYKDFINVINLIKDVSKTVNISPKIVIVAPPIPNDKNLNAFLKEKFSKENNIFVIQSKKFHLKLWDGIHPNVESSKIWANKIINFVEKVSKN